MQFFSLLGIFSEEISNDATGRSPWIKSNEEEVTRREM